MSVVYMTKDTGSIHQEGNRLIIKENGTFLTGMPIKNADGIVVTSNASISSKVIHTMLKQGSYIVFTDWQGRYEGILCASRSNLKMVNMQMKACSDDALVLQMAKYILQHKISNQIFILKLFAKYRKSIKLKEAAARLQKHLEQLELVADCNEARGLEGICAKEYFAVFDEIIDKKEFSWKGRNRQPSRDPVNSLLNYSYAYLEREVRLLTLGIGLDERYGFLHTNNGRKDSLIYDVMELFRQSVSDRLVFNCLGRKTIKRDDFYMDGDKCLLTDAGKRKWIESYEKWMQSDEHGRSYLEKEIRELCSFLEQLQE